MTAEQQLKRVCLNQAIAEIKATLDFVELITSQASQVSKLKQIALAERAITRLARELNQLLVAETTEPSGKRAQNKEHTDDPSYQ
jgi:hypothetical protein